MTAASTMLAGAPATGSEQWLSINWDKVKAHVHRLQMRIAKAFREGRHGKVKSLQWLLTHSHYAQLLAVKRVTQNKGGNTPGIDNVTWKTPTQKMKAVGSLKRRGYQPLPLKRIYIPKKQKGKLRPLSIPTLRCRAMQALHLLALEPVAEMMADKNAYGFRPHRSTADALERCFKTLAKKGSAHYVLEGDIKSCFDEISHTWLLENVPMDKRILKQWLTAGYIDKKQFFASKQGTPQGGIISPTLLTITLSGLEAQLQQATRSLYDKVYLCTYADDFIITGATKAVLTDTVIPVVKRFLDERGLTLSVEKTLLTHIEEGFDFLGTNVRKYNGKLICKPAKSSIKALLDKIRQIIKRNATAKTEDLIQQLNPVIRGWANYHRHSCAKRTFSSISNDIFKLLWQWARKRHPKKSAKWVKRKYFRSQGLRNWVFSACLIDNEGKSSNVDLFEISHVPIKRHVKIRAQATPYDPASQDYFKERCKKRRRAGNSKAKRTGQYSRLEAKIHADLLRQQNELETG